MNLYFAYGSNMDEAQMRERCPESKLIGVACLPGYRIAFTIQSRKWNGGCADIITASDGSVYGVLYELSDSDLVMLDKKEGVLTNSYRRIQVFPDHEGKSVQVYAYEVVSKQEGLHPSGPYIQQILRAAERFKFPEAYLSELRSFMNM